MYLQLMGNVRDAFLNKALAPLRRIFLIWQTLFFLRIWRKWLEENGYCEADHFITLNAYTCIEINAHLLVCIVVNIINGIFPVDSLRVWKTGSQSCEQMFRLLRSMTPTFSTVINFTLKGMMDRAHKISFLEELEASDEIQFPRAKRRLLHLNEESADSFKIPAMEDITMCISEAKSLAIDKSKNCGMEISAYSNSYLVEGKVKLIDIATSDDGEIDFEQVVDDEINVTIDKNIQEDINKIKLVKSKSSSFPTYSASNTSDDHNSRRKYNLKSQLGSGFLEYEGAYIRKKTALYLLQENAKLSNDRLLRVREEQPSHLPDIENYRSVAENCVKIGDTCIFKRIDMDKYLIGKIVQFSYLTGNKRERQYSANYIDMSKDTFEGIGTFANWFSVVNNDDSVSFRLLDGIFTFGYIPMTLFVCKVDENLLYNCTESSFSISSGVLNNLFPDWKKSFTYESEFLPNN